MNEFSPSAATPDIPGDEPRESASAACWGWMQQDLTELKQRGLLRTRRLVVPVRRGRCRVDGVELWNFSGNDSLGLAGDRRVRAGATAAIRLAGVGARASALVSGRTFFHAELEQRLAAFKGTEAAILFPSGYAANLGTIAALAGPEDVIYCDRLNHASLVDGCRLSRAQFRVYPHCDAAALEADLRRRRPARRRFIVTESLFSMDGDAAPLARLVELAHEFDALLIVDEAHATGVFGAQGRGLLEARGVHSDRVLMIGTLSKALGSQGGFVACSQIICDWLWNFARTQMFSTALTVPACSAALVALSIIEQNPKPRRWLLSAARRVREALREQGWHIPPEVIGPIIPVHIGDPDQTVLLAEQLRQRGILVGAIRPPTVPRGTSRLRISLSVAHRSEGINQLLRTFAQLECPVRGEPGEQS